MKEEYKIAVRLCDQSKLAVLKDGLQEHFKDACENITLIPYCLGKESPSADMFIIIGRKSVEAHNFGKRKGFTSAYTAGSADWVGIQKNEGSTLRAAIKKAITQLDQKPPKNYKPNSENMRKLRDNMFVRYWRKSELLQPLRKRWLRHNSIF